MSDINLSLLGMYNQMQREDGVGPTFLDATVLMLPESFTNDDRNHLAQLILSETAELEPVYPDPATMVTVVKAWSSARVPAWERILAALEEEYNPIHNYDRTEVETGSDTGTRTTADTGTKSTADTGTVTDADTGTIQDTTGSTVTGQTTGFNSASFADDKKTTSSGTAGSTRNLQLQRTNNLNRLETNNLSQQETRNLANTRNLHVFGNIGVTTAAQMITGEMDIRKWDIFRIIADEFERYFCLLVY